ncbi:MAG TPA: PIN domain-containing protein [Acidimicrobiales bacterium]|nr:PIN domain-containing protein [Acidimicrobiales bacterium]
MARTRYLADTSVFGRLSKPSVVAAFAPLAAGGLVGLCSPVAFELGYSARSADDYEALAERLSSFTAVPTTDADHRRALEVQATLAARSQHRALSLVDALVAAAAEARDLVVLHYDADFELVAQVTGQAQEWVVPRGTAD